MKGNNFMSNRKRFTHEQRLIIYGKYNNKCAYCGEPLQYKTMQIDHIVPYSRFDLIKKKPKDLNLNSFENLNPSCTNCNTIKSNLTIDEFREHIWKALRKKFKKIKKRNGIVKLGFKYNLLKLEKKKIIFFFEKFESGK